MNLAYTYALARELSGGGVTVNVAYPRNVATALGRNAGGILKGVQLVGRLFKVSPEKGARTSFRLASDPAIGRRNRSLFQRQEAGHAIGGFA